MQNIAKYFGILQNLGMGCGIGKKLYFGIEMIEFQDTGSS